ncbi:MAG: FAD-dependent monooxygenase [Pseudomonadota bacterium]
MTSQQTDVLIVGAGPVGIITAIMFEKLGVKCTLIERRATLHLAPQAHIISARSMEICRMLGIEDGPIRVQGPEPLDTVSVRWVDQLAGRDLGVYSFIRDPDAVEKMFASTPTPVGQLSQDLFEAHLVKYLSDDTPILFEHKWTGMRAEGDGYVSTVERADGSTHDIHARFVIGSDGAGSRVRSAIGAEMEGPKFIQSYINVHFHANMRELVKDREGVLYWIMDPDAYGCFIAHNIDKNWIFMKNLDVEQPPKEIDEAKYEGLLRKAIGADVEIDIQSMSTWVMSAQVANAYQKDGVFLVGDAAHRFPPTGGIGMNTGFQDAFNLTWKIAMVLKGRDPKLLDTYEPERRPSAVANSKQSHANYLKMAEVDKTLDFDGDGVATMADFDKVLADPTRLAEVAEAVNNQAAHFSMGGLDLGVCYTSDAIVSDGPPPVSPNPISVYVPSTTPGTRLPHCWLNRGDERISTVDLIETDAFLVLSFKPQDHATQAAAAALKAGGYPVSHLTLSTDSDLQPDDDQFANLFSPDEVLLVRPDGHIAARFAGSEAAQRLEQAIVQILGPADV